MVDLAVGAGEDENAELGEGALYILLMTATGGVKYNVKISDGLAGFTPTELEYGDRFAWSLSPIGDLDGDGVVDLAVGAPQDENLGMHEGAVYILFMTTTGGVKSHVKISDGLNGFTPSELDDNDAFGVSVAGITDLDGDGVQDLLVGAASDEAVGGVDNSEGAVYILFMTTTGGVKSHVKISDGLNGFTPSGLQSNDAFGSRVAEI